MLGNMDDFYQSLVRQRQNEIKEQTKTEYLLKEQRKSRKVNRLWDIPGYGRLFASYSISTIGQWFDMVALMIIFGYVWVVEPFMLALIPVAFGLPQALLAQFAGVLIEKVNKIKLIIIADSLTVILTIALFFAPSPAIAILLIAIRASINVVHYPTQQSLIRQLVPEALRVKAITWNGGLNQSAKVIAPLIGGSLITIMPAHYLLWVTAAAFLISVFLLLSIVKVLPIKAPHKVQELRQTESFWKQWREGWSYVFKQRLLSITIFITIIGMMIIQLIDVQFPILFRELRPTEPEIVTWIIASVGIGSVITLLILNRFSEFKNIQIWLAVSLSLIGVSFLGLSAISTNFVIIIPIILGFLIGIGTAISLVISNYVITTEPSMDKVSSVSGIFQSLMSTTVFVAPLIGAFFIQMTSVQSIFLLCSCLLLMTALITFLEKAFSWKRKKLKVFHHS
ncbi:putative MFS transporter [Bacillus sp. TS-2]|nr:putative MFS transporter [Bacillus sp. TS-2]